jgi:hypothetical protein
MKRFAELMILVISILFAYFFFIAQQTYAGAIFDTDIEIIQSDQSGVTLRYIVPEASFSPIGPDNIGFSRLLIPRTAQIGKDGQVEIPVKIVPLAMPPGARPRITVIEINYQDAAFKKVMPFFSTGSPEEFNEAFSSPAAQSPKIPQDAPYIADIDEIRGLIVTRVAIPTARYSLIPPSLSLLKSITIRIDFEGGVTTLAAGFKDPGQVFDRILRRTIANFDQGQNWFLPRPASTLSTASPFDSAATWIRIELNTDGIYAIGWTHFNLAGVNPADIDPSRIRVFYGGGRELPTRNNQPRPTLREIPIKVIGGGDGSFDGSDQVVFYADAIDSWDYSVQFQRYMAYKNHYTDRNVYWLTIDGNFSSVPRRFSAYNGSPDGPYDALFDWYKAWVHREQDRDFQYVQVGTNYYNWFWGNTSRFTTSIQLYDVIQGQPATVIVRNESGSPNLNVNGGAAELVSRYQTYSTFSTTALANGANNFEAYYATNFLLDYFDVGYARWLKVLDGTMLFSQPDTFGIIRYTLSDVASPYTLLDISDKMNPVEITGAGLSGTTLTFDDTVSAQSNKRYFISSSARYKSPAALQIYQMDNLRNAANPENRADELIITYDGFHDQAVRFAQHRQQTYGLRTRVVDISEVYNQFSFGPLDPTAIRDFLKYAYENWPEPAPTFAFLIGDGNYDFRNNLGHNLRNYMPPWENTGFMTDEYFLYFGNDYYLDTEPDSLPDMVVGRLNARSAQEVDDFITKTVDYDLNPDLGPWRHRIVVVADDNLHPPNTSTETFHTSQAEVLSNQHVPGKFETNKIYLIEYLMQAGGEKPEAREDVISAFNQGALIINWIGHGSANLWADERIFRRIQDIPRLANGKRMPLVFTASCSIGKFDFPANECMAEEFIRNSTNGTISVISATRDVYAAPNAELNNHLFDQLLLQDSSGIGESLYMAKLLRSRFGPTDNNDMLYMVFGDPAQLLQYPKFDVNLTLAPDSLVALSVDSVAGEIVDEAGGIRSDFNGTVWVTVKDGSSQRSVMLRNRLNVPLPSPGTITYMAEGATIFIGPAEVRGGRFASRFFIPKDVSYGSRGAKIYAYAENGSFDALGVQDSLLVSGSLPALRDSIGPQITLSADTRPFAAGLTMVPSNFTLGAYIFDDHGVNITGQLGHSIVASIDDGEVFEADVTGYFRFDQGDYQGGRLEFRLPELPLGEHTLTLKAWDNFNNSAMITRGIEVVANGELAISDVMNYPNPIRSGDNSTAFQYCLNNDVDRIMIKIFTEAGRKIKTIELTSSGQTDMGCEQVPWNLLDADNDPLANGIYLYQVSAERTKTDGGKEETDQTGKLVILR